MGDGRGNAVLAAVTPGDDAVTDRAALWIEPYWNAEHLRRTVYWLLELEPDAGEALQLAALTHDMERHFPGRPQRRTLSIPPAADTAYRAEHSARSARIVGEWLREPRDRPRRFDRRGRAPHSLARSRRRWRDADLLQAADSLSFLEVNVDVP